MEKDLMSSEISKLTEALAKAKVNFGPIVKNKTVKTPSFSYDYADLPSIEEAINKPLMEQGLAVLQPITIIGEQRVLITILSHISGQWMKGIMPLSPYNGKMQESGKEITYLRRYALCSMLCITAEDDTDGNPIVGHDKSSHYDSKTSVKLSKEQLDTIKVLTKDHPDVREETLKTLGKSMFREIEASKFPAILSMMETKIKQKGVVHAAG